VLSFGSGSQIPNCDHCPCRSHTSATKRVGSFCETRPAGKYRVVDCKKNDVIWSNRCFLSPFYPLRQVSNSVLLCTVQNNHSKWRVETFPIRCLSQQRSCFVDRFQLFPLRLCRFHALGRVFRVGNDALLWCTAMMHPFQAARPSSPDALL
jgi:hypothetical protein